MENIDWSRLYNTLSHNFIKYELQSSAPTTFVLVKPMYNDERNIIAQKIAVDYIKERFKNCGLTISNDQVVQYDPQATKQHYKEHCGQPFYPKLESLFLSNTSYGMFVRSTEKEGNPLKTVREMAGATIKVDKNGINFYKEGTIRYDLSFMIYQMVELGKSRDEVVIPKNIAECKLHYDLKNDAVLVFYKDKLINVASKTANIIHSSGTYAEALNEIDAYDGVCVRYNKKQQKSNAKFGEKKKIIARRISVKNNECEGREK